jgi:hypothetical protein
MFENSRKNEVKMKAIWSDLTVAEQTLNSRKTVKKLPILGQRSMPH